MRHFSGIFIVASGLAAASAAATTFLPPEDAHPIDATFEQALGADNAGDIAGVGIAKPNAGTNYAGLAVGYSWATDLANLGDSAGGAFADTNASASGDVNQILGIDVFGSIAGAAQPNAQTAFGLQDASGAIYMLDRFGSSLGQALGVNKR